MRATTAFAARIIQDNPVCGPDFLFILGPALPPLGCLPSSLYTFFRSAPAPSAWLGVTPLPASPNLTGDRAEVSFCTAHSSWGEVVPLSPNQRITPHGIEPNELPDCSTPQRNGSEAPGTMSNHRMFRERLSQERGTSSQEQGRLCYGAKP